MSTTATQKKFSGPDLLARMQENGDILPLVSVDPWVWAVHTKLRLVAGRFSPKGHEYQVEPMQSTARVVVIRKATQLGFTEACVLRCLHSLITGRYPLGILYLFPTKDDVTDFSTSRFKPLINDNYREIGRYITDTDRANLKRIKRAYIFFRSGRLSQSIEGQRTSTKLKSIPVDACVFDEWDEMDPGAREMAISRMQHSQFKHETYLANPTIPDFGIDKLYQASDQRKWFIRCDFCRKHTCLEDEFPGCIDRVGGKWVRVCRSCGREIRPGNGHWEPTCKGRDIVGYSVSHLVSTFIDPGELRVAWESEDLDRANFFRLKLGLPYIGATDRLSKRDIYGCCGSDPIFLRHKGPCAMGIDVGSRLHVVVMDRPTEKTWRVIFIGKFKEFEDVWDAVRNLGIGCCVIDKYPETRKAREWGRSAPFPTYLCEYQEHTHGFGRWDEKLYETVVNRTEICDETHELIVKPGRCILPRLSEEVKEYAEQMTNLAKVKRVDEKTKAEKYVYIKLKDNDHYRHATNYAWLASTKVTVSREAGYGGIDLRKRRGEPINWMTL